MSATSQVWFNGAVEAAAEPRRPHMWRCRFAPNARFGFPDATEDVVRLDPRREGVLCAGGWHTWDPPQGLAASMLDSGAGDRAADAYFLRRARI